MKSCNEPWVAANAHLVEGHPPLADDEHRAFERFLEDSIVVPVQACFIDIGPAEVAKVQAELVWDGKSIWVETPDDGGWQAFSDCVETAATEQRADLRTFPAARVRFHTYRGSCPVPLAS